MTTKSKSPSCGLKTDKWGPCFWMHMHLVAAGFPLKYAKHRRRAYMRYFKDIGQVLPCSKCRVHYQSIVKQYIDRGTYESKFKDRKTLQVFVHGIHNKINKRLNKPIRSIKILETYDTQFIEDNFRASC